MTTSFSIRRAAPSVTPTSQPTTTTPTEQISDQIKPKQSRSKTLTELTRNSKYLVSNRPAIPQSLQDPNPETYAQVDSQTRHVIHSTPSTITIWNYNSVDTHPLTVQLPVTPSNAGFAPIALLASPAAGSAEPGVLVLNSHTGHIRFYEDIANASSVGLLKQHKGLDYQARLYDREYITIAEVIEPVGIICTTSFGRLIQVSFRDAVGKASISTFEIQGKQTGFFSTYLHPSKEIVSIKSGSVIGQGERIISTLTKGGKFDIYCVGRDGQHKTIYKSELFELLVSHVEGLYPLARQTLQVLDLAFLTDITDGDYFLALSCFENNGEVIYVLFTLKKDAEDLLIYSAYKMNTFAEPYGEKLPRVYAPSPGSTAFVVFDHSIVLVELITEFNGGVNLKKKWEDIVSFREDFQIIASGVETDSEAPAINFVTPGVGVLKIERLPQMDDDKQAQSVGVIKSHIEQAVFYGDDSDEQNPIEFDLPELLTVDNSEIGNDLLEVADEILLSKSSYLPPSLSNLQHHLELRQSKIERLLKYASVNFQDSISVDVKAKLISTYEKLSSALNLHKALSIYSTNNELSQIFKDSVLGSTGSSSKNADQFFLTGLSNLSTFLSSFLAKLSKHNALQDISTEIIIATYTPILSIEQTYRSSLFNLTTADIPSFIPWYISAGLYEQIDEVYQRYTKSHQDNINAEITETVIDLTNILFYVLQQRIVWYNNKPTKTTEDVETITKDEAFYKLKSGVWTKTLVCYGAKEQALEIAENYKDLKSLVEILDDEREAFANDEAKLDEVLSRFEAYFLRFGYEFAETLYAYYIHTNKLQALLYGFRQYDHYLRRFFQENDHKKISWIEDTLHGENLKAAFTLYEASTTTDQQSTKKIQLSIAKLSAMASLNDHLEDESTMELLQSIQENLDFAEAQDLILGQLQPFLRSDGDASAQVSAIVIDLLRKPYDQEQYPMFTYSFQRALTRLLSNQTLTVAEMIDILTLLDYSKTSQPLNFFYALKLVHLSNLSYSEKQVSEQLIWRRAALADDWVKIKETSQNKSNEFKKELNENTVLYQTLLNSFKDELFVAYNDYAISLPSNDRITVGLDNALHYKFLSESELAKLEKEVSLEVEQVNESVNSVGLDQVIKALIGTSNEESGVNKVVNYEDLSIVN